MVINSTKQGLNTSLLEGITFYLTIGILVVVFIILMVIVVKKSIKKLAERRLADAFEEKGYTDKFTKTGTGKLKPTEKEIMEEVTNLREYEKRLKKKEKALHLQIERMYKHAQSVAKKHHRLSKKERELSNEDKHSKKIIIPKENLNEDVRKVLKITDELLEKLPEKEIKRFVNSDEFKIYRKVMKEVKDGSS
jgi:sensor c-di-GMP phosphodiesterase-like protein